MMHPSNQDLIGTQEKHLEISSIKEGIVLDHIPSGEGIRIFNHLVLNMLDFPIALFVNLPSPSLHTKDVITIESTFNMNLSFLDNIHPNITINIVRDYQIVNKMQISSGENIQDYFC